MAKRVVEVRECDRCGKEPAHTWTITGPEGAVREIELCERHGAAVANAYALGRAVPRRTTRLGPARRRGTGAAEPSSGGSSSGGPSSVDPPALPQPEPEPVWR